MLQGVDVCGGPGAGERMANLGDEWGSGERAR